MKIPTSLALLLAFASPVCAQTGGVQLNYAAYVAGFNVFNVQAGIDLQPDRYGVGLHVKTAGTVGLVFRGDTMTLVQGRFQDGAIQPSAYDSVGMWRGNPHITRISYSGGKPDVRRLVPDNDEEARESVPPALQLGSIDSISAIAHLLHVVAETGKCEGETTTFDGRRASQVRVRTLGPDTLPHESRSSFAGPALKCEISGHQLAGFARDAGPDDFTRKPQVAYAWLAQLSPAGPMVPVLMSFPTKLFGYMNVYVTESQTGVNLAAFTPPKLEVPAPKPPTRQAVETLSR